MKKTIILLTVIISLFLLISCVTKTVVVQNQPVRQEQPIVPVKTETPQQQIIEPVPKQAPEEKTKISAECKIAEGAMDNLKATMENEDEVVRTGLSVNSYLDVKIGECVMFPFAIRNGFTDSREFMVQIDFAQATDRSPIANTMTADRNLMNSWLTESELGPKKISSNQYRIFLLKIKIGDTITQTQKTQPGTYRFDVQAYNRVGESSTSKYEAKKEIFVRVLE
jgi:hypothetical protein